MCLPSPFHLQLWKPYCSLGKYGLFATLCDAMSLATSGVLVPSLPDVQKPGPGGLTLSFATEDTHLHVPSFVLHACLDTLVDLSCVDSGLQLNPQEVASSFNSFDALLEVLGRLHTSPVDSGIKLTLPILHKALVAISNFTADQPIIASALCKADFITVSARVAVLSLSVSVGSLCSWVQALRESSSLVV